MSVCPTAAQIQSLVAPLFSGMTEYVAQVLSEAAEQGSFDLAVFESELLSLIHAVGRCIMVLVLESLDPSERRLVTEDGVLTRCVESWLSCLTRFGEVRVRHGLYRPSGRNPESCSLVSQRAGLVADYFTPAAARLALLVLADSTLRDSSRTCQEAGMAVSATSLRHLLTHSSSLWEADRELYEALLREVESVPESAQTVAMSVDGVMALVRASQGEVSVTGEQNDAQNATEVGATHSKRKIEKTVGKTVGKTVSYRELGCATVALYDAAGERLRTTYYGRMPEERKGTLGQQAFEEMKHIELCRPGLRRVYLCDGAEVNWRMAAALEEQLRQLNSEGAEPVWESIQIVDFFHACEHLKRAVVAIFGENSPRGERYYQDQKYCLRHFDGGVGQLWRSLKYHLRHTKGEARKRLRAEITYFWNQWERMDYVRYERLNLPIGSGVVEAACKTLVTSRMKRSGMRWGKEGGQAILNLRAWLRSGRFDTAWSILAHASQNNSTALNTYQAPRLKLVA